MYNVQRLYENIWPGEVNYDDTKDVSLLSRYVLEIFRRVCGEHPLSVSPSPPPINAVAHVTNLIVRSSLLYVTNLPNKTNAVTNP